MSNELTIRGEPIAHTIITCPTLDELQQLGLQLKEDTQKFPNYYKDIIHDLRQIWAKRHDFLTRKARVGKRRIGFLRGDAFAKKERSR